MDSAENTGNEANRLYWETDLPVGEIAERLDISRRALYEAVRPVPAEGTCGSCGGRLEYTNRSTRSHGFATCSRCGADAASTPEPAWTWSPRSHEPELPVPAAPWPRSVWWLGAATLAGALAAAAVTLVIVRDE